MTTKNPFEIRTELLQMAKDYLDQQYHMNMDFARNAFEKAMAEGKANFADWKAAAPTIYSIEELTKKAQELYGFVESKKK